MIPSPHDLLQHPDVQQLIARALEEDLGPGDVTSEAMVPPGTEAAARLIARQACRLAGGLVARAVFLAAEPRLRCVVVRDDGSVIAADEVVLEVEGPARGILAAERVALNLVQRLSGIATLTGQYVQAIASTGVMILDTRKTVPGMRRLEKYAVACGGGVNHRIGLFDRILIKDNHLAFWRQHQNKSIAEAIAVARRRFPDLLVEVEVENETELQDALVGKPDWILLDNMTPPQLERCVALVRKQCLLEASGGITLDSVGAVARTGVDAISVGALTHSAPAVDFSLEFEPESHAASD